MTINISLQIEYADRYLYFYFWGERYINRTNFTRINTIAEDVVDYKVKYFLES